MIANAGVRETLLTPGLGEYWELSVALTVATGARDPVVWAVVCGAAAVAMLALGWSLNRVARWRQELKRNVRW